MPAPSSPRHMHHIAEGGGCCPGVCSVLVVVFAAFAAALFYSPTLHNSHFSDKPFEWPDELQYFPVDVAADLTLNCYESGPDPATSKGVIIFVHGFPDTAASWKDYVLHFGELGYHARACDMRNVNRSIATVTTGVVSFDRMVDDVLGIATDTGQTEVVVVGHDWGAAVAQGFAAKYPQKTRALVSMAIPHLELYRRYNFIHMPFSLRHTWYFLFFGSTGAIGRWKIARDDFEWFIWFVFGNSQPGTFSKAEIGRFKEMYRDTMTSALRSTVSTWYEMGTYWLVKSLLPPFLHGSEVMASVWEPVTPITVPTLQILAKRDKFVKSVDMVESTKPGIHMTHPLSAQIIYDASHWLNFEKRAEIIVDIQAYLDDVLD